jgi:hypothetical protein
MAALLERIDSHNNWILTPEGKSDVHNRRLEVSEQCE